MLGSRCSSAADIVLVGIVQFKLSVVQTRRSGIDVDLPVWRIGWIVRRKVGKRRQRDADLRIAAGGDAVQIHKIGGRGGRRIVDNRRRTGGKKFSASGCAEG